MQTKLAYYDDPYLKTFVAKAVFVKSVGEKTEVVLDQTIFYPGGGGQPFDIGSINGLEIERVQMMNGEVVHTIKGLVRLGEKVKLELDFDRRYKYMQIHSAGHLIHDVLMTKIKELSPLKAEHGDHAYLQYQGELSGIDADQLEEMVNEAVKQGINILTKFVSYEELEKECKVIQPGLPKNKPLRMLRIGKFSAMADGGIQVKNTKELGYVSITKISVSEGKTTIHYEMGKKEKPAREMKLFISQDFHKKHPDVNLAMVEVGRVKVDKSEVLKAGDYQNKDNFEGQKLINAFQKFYKDLGLGAKAGYPAVENLYRRFAKDQYIPRINNVVDASNKISVQTLIPGGVFDSDQIKGNMTLRFSSASEEYRPLGGGTEALPEGIAVIADEEKILNLFPYRDSIYPKITSKTKNVVVLADKVEGVDIELTKKAAIEIALLLEKISGGRAGQVTVGQVSEGRISFVKKQGKKRVFSGTRATGRLHLGNYLGAVKGYIELQNNSDYECIYMAVDVHTITTPYDYKNLSEATRNIIMDYLACGLDPKKSIITVQSLVPEHTDLAFLFSSVISVARMQHLPTFKEKIQQHPDNVTMALLNYPVLMAADILIYKAGLVPVGIDQEPHLEVAREIARKMNEAFGTDFPEPKRFATKGEYVPSLLGEGKMSKSIEGSYINLIDDLETIKQKLAATPTDSGQGERVPTSGGVANLLTFVELFQGQEKRADYEKKYTGSGIRYSELKIGLAESIYKDLEPIREKRQKLEAKSEYVSQVIKDGAARARIIAQKTIDEVKEKMGLRGGL